MVHLGRCPHAILGDLLVMSSTCRVHGFAQSGLLLVVSSWPSLHACALRWLGKRCARLALALRQNSCLASNEAIIVRLRSAACMNSTSQHLPCVQPYMFPFCMLCFALVSTVCLEAWSQRQHCL